MKYKKIAKAGRDGKSTFYLVLMGYHNVIGLTEHL
jgi:hypothetical protein